MKYLALIALLLLSACACERVPPIGPPVCEFPRLDQILP